MSFLCSPFCRHFFFPVFSILSTFFAFSFFAHHRRQHTVNAAALIYLVFLSCISSLVSLYEIIVFAVLKIPFEFQYTLEDSWLAVFCALFNGTFFRYAENNFILFCSHFHDLFFRKMKLKEKHITRFWVWASKDMLWINIHQLLRKYIASCSNLNGDTSLDLHCGLKIRFNTCLISIKFHCVGIATFRSNVLSLVDSIGLSSPDFQSWIIDSDFYGFSVSVELFSSTWLDKFHLA